MDFGKTTIVFPEGAWAAPALRVMIDGCPVTSFSSARQLPSWGGVGSGNHAGEPDSPRLQSYGEEGQF